MSDARAWLRDLLRAEPVLGSGSAPEGTWEIKAAFKAVGKDAPRRLYFWVDLWDEAGRSAAGHACGGLGLADRSRPIVVSMSCRGPRTSFCYVGQTELDAKGIELTLSDGSSFAGTVLRGDLPVQLWIAFTDPDALPVKGATFDEHGGLAVRAISPEEWPADPDHACWGPFDGPNRIVVSGSASL